MVSTEVNVKASHTGPLRPVLTSSARVNPALTI